MTATAEQVAAELKKIGLTATVHKADQDKHVMVDYVNVWIEPGDRYPATSVYAPYQQDGWTWGSNFQYGAYADDDAETVATKISRTLA